MNVIARVIVSFSERTIHTHVGPFREPGRERAGPIAPVRTSELVSPPKKIKDVPPTYPSRAQARRVQGTVLLEATIGVDGHVTHVVVLKSVPFLDEAAMDAVRQWEYEPTQVDGQPVPVVMLVSIGFSLQ